MAIKYSFTEMLNANRSSNPKMLKLKSECVKTGRYYLHLQRWLKEIKPENIFIFDSNLFEKDPITYLNEIQAFLGLKEVDYSKILQYNKKKSAYCLDNEEKCFNLNSNFSIDKNSTYVLRKIYAKSNVMIKNLLNAYGLSIPSWMKM